MGGLISQSGQRSLRTMKNDIHDKRLPIITFTQTLDTVSQASTNSLWRMPTNPAEKDEDIFEKDITPLPVVCAIVCGESCRDSKVVEHEKGHQSPIQRRLPVSAKIRRSLDRSSHTLSITFQKSNLGVRILRGCRAGF